MLVEVLCKVESLVYLDRAVFIEAIVFTEC